MKGEARWRKRPAVSWLLSSEIIFTRRNSNMDKTLKKEATHAVSEMDNLLNKHSCTFLGMECALKEALDTAEMASVRMFSETIATSFDRRVNSQGKNPHSGAT
jgi:vacuolar-type H+-ATPase catalytic subunit A/Vma1